MPSNALSPAAGFVTAGKASPPADNAVSWLSTCRRPVIKECCQHRPGHPRRSLGLPTQRIWFAAV